MRQRVQIGTVVQETDDTQRTVVPYRMLRKMLDQLRAEKVANRHVERTRKANQVQRRAVSDAALDARHVTAANSRHIGERFLRKFSVFTQLAYSRP